MCLAIPMRVVQVDAFEVRCEARGVEQTASLLLMGPEAIQVGDYVRVQLGKVVEKVSRDEARIAWQLLDRMLSPATRETELDWKPPRPPGYQ
jgi:hydrogenase expression/formation protein HypC